MFIESYKKIIILFWLIWWSIAFVTDFLDALYELKVIHVTWAVKSDNYSGLLKALSIFNAPTWVSGVLYTVIIVWLFVIVIYFGKAFIGICMQTTNLMQKINHAFYISMLLWLAFFLADQLILNFGLEENHMVQGGFELLTWMTLYIFPTKK